MVDTTSPTPTLRPTNTVRPTTRLHYPVTTPSLTITVTPTEEATDNTLITSVPTISPTSYHTPTPVVAALPDTGNVNLITILGLTFILVFGAGGVYWYSKRK